MSTEPFVRGVALFVRTIVQKLWHYNYLRVICKNYYLIRVALLFRTVLEQGLNFIIRCTEKDWSQDMTLASGKSHFRTCYQN